MFLIWLNKTFVPIIHEDLAVVEFVLLDYYLNISVPLGGACTSITGSASLMQMLIDLPIHISLVIISETANITIVNRINVNQTFHSRTDYNFIQFDNCKFFDSHCCIHLQIFTLTFI